MDKLNFSYVETRKAYIAKRLDLLDSMILFFCFDSNDFESEIWVDWLNELHQNFKKHIEIVLIDVQKSDDNLKSSCQHDKADPESPFIKIITCHPHIEPVFHDDDLSPFEYYKFIEEFYQYYETQYEKDKVVMFERVKKMLDFYPVVVFIKGVPHDPFCKFSRQFINMLNSLEVRYKSYDIFKDDKFKGWLKIYGGWKTFPQLHINGKVIGGVDVLTKLINEEKIMEMIPKECKIQGSIDDLKDTIEKNPLVVFGDGKKIGTEDKNTEKMLKMLDDKDSVYHYFDLMADEMKRNSLNKLYGDSIKFPILFKEGKIVENWEEYLVNVIKN